MSVDVNLSQIQGIFSENHIFSLYFPFQLPFHIDVIKCPKEIPGKSTAVHAAILAKDHVTIYDYPVIPKYEAQDVGKDVFTQNVFVFLFNIFLAYLGRFGFTRRRFDFLDRSG